MTSVMSSTTSPIFNFADSDITIESTDGIRFLVHRKNMETHTEAFPGSEFKSTSDDVLKLTESGEVLELLFQFVYPRRQPVLSGLKFELLLALAEAVQKYRVFCAMNVCESQLKTFVEARPLDVLVHALRHYGDYETLALVDSCALNLIRKGEPFVIVSKFFQEGLDSGYIVKWIHYEELWKGVFDKVRDAIEAKPLWEDCWTEKHLCSSCRNCLISWVDDLQQAKTLSSLRLRLSDPKFPKQHHHQSHDRCRYCKHHQCKHLSGLVTLCLDLVNAMPEFSHIDNGNHTADGHEPDNESTSE